MRGWIPLLFNYRFMTTKRDIDLRRKHLTILRWRHNQEILSDLADKYEQGRRAALLWHNREKRRAWDALKEFSAGEGARIRHLAKRALSHWRRCAAGLEGDLRVRAPFPFVSQPRQPRPMPNSMATPTPMHRDPLPPTHLPTLLTSPRPLAPSTRPVHSPRPCAPSMRGSFEIARGFHTMDIRRDARHKHNARTRAALVRWVRRSSLRAMRKWAPQGARRRVLLVACTALVRRESHRAMQTWLLAQLERLEDKRLVLLGLGSLAQRGQRLGFNAWAELLAARSANSLAISQGVAAFRYRLSRRWFSR